MNNPTRELDRNRRKFNPIILPTEDIKGYRVTNVYTPWWNVEHVWQETTVNRRSRRKSPLSSPRRFGS